MQKMITVLMILVSTFFANSVFAGDNDMALIAGPIEKTTSINKTQGVALDLVAQRHADETGAVSGNS